MAGLHTLKLKVVIEERCFTFVSTAFSLHPGVYVYVETRRWLCSVSVASVREGGDGTGVVKDGYHSVYEFVREAGSGKGFLMFFVGKVPLARHMGDNKTRCETPKVENESCNRGEMAGAGPSRGRSNIKTFTSFLGSDGSWVDSRVLFPVPPLTIDPEAYFTSMDRYYRKNHIDPPQFDSAKLDSEWGGYDHLKYRSSFQYSKWKDFLSKAFQIGGDYSWRAPTPSERLYSWPDDGAIVMPLEHLKAGLTPKPHKFLVALFKQQFKCTPTQFTPNSIRLILWFIAACDHSSRQPTFEAFFTIFSSKKSNCAPFYEIAQGNKNSRVGLLADGHKPVKLATTRKHWQYEYVVIRGGDWSYMPGFSSKVEPQCVIRRDTLSDNQVKNCADLLHIFEFVWGEAEFQSVSKIKFYGLYPPASIDMPELAWGKDRKKIEEILKSGPPKPEHLNKQGDDDDADMEDEEVEGVDAELDEEVFEPRLGDHKRVPVDVGNGLDLIGSCPGHVGTNTSEPTKHQENVTTEAWVEGDNPVNFHTVFTDCFLVNDDFFVGGLDGGSVAPAGETLVADNEEPLMSPGVPGERGKDVEEGDNLGRVERAIGEGVGGVRRALRARPKTLVSCSRLGMKRRKGVGYLFPTAPKAVLPEMLTPDDRGKLAKSTKKEDNYKEAEESFAADRKRLEDQVREAVADANRAKEKLEVLEEQLAAMPSATHVVRDYKGSPAYKKDCDDAVAAFRATSVFREIVGAESQKMAPLIVACSREFFRDDLRRPKDDFDVFFVEWMKARREAYARMRAHPPP
ncbi:hypothetical protein POM88_044025 [Heracleum sosnowskyi]|uniref:Uncharacterized protein n=1 Tax=Heracleum sosnowskyi TaxID=360622 RepID=A0AAD8M3L3_9APIA|nr:hypothetical protein POM88_044025 [Heracleum sosnowskyi]